MFFQSHSQSLHTHCPSSLTQSLRTQLSLRSQAPSLFKHSCLVILSFFTLSFQSHSVSSHTVTCQSFQSHSVSSHTVTCQSFQSHPVRLFTDSCPSSLTQSLHTVTCPRSSLTLSVSSVTNSCPLDLTQSLLTQLLSFQSHTQSLHTQLSFTRARARAHTHTHTHTHPHHRNSLIILKQHVFLNSDTLSTSNDLRMLHTGAPRRFQFYDVYKMILFFLNLFFFFSLKTNLFFVFCFVLFFTYKNKLYKPDRASDFSEIGSSSSRELSYSFYCDLRIRIHTYV